MQTSALALVVLLLSLIIGAMGLGDAQHVVERSLASQHEAPHADRDRDGQTTRTIPGPGNVTDAAAGRLVTWSPHEVADDPAARDLEGTMHIDDARRHLALGARAHLDVAWLEGVLVLVDPEGDGSPVYNTGMRVERIRFDPPLVHDNGSALAEVVLPSLAWRPDAEGQLAASAQVHAAWAEDDAGDHDEDDRGHGWGNVSWRVDVMERMGTEPSSPPPWRPLAIGSTLQVLLPDLASEASAETDVTFEVLLDYGGSATATGFIDVAEPQGTAAASENGTDAGADEARHNAGVALERSGRHAWFIVQPATGLSGAEIEAAVALDPANGGGSVPIHDAREGAADRASAPDDRARLAPLRLAVTVPLAPVPDGAGGLELSWHMELGYGFTADAWERDVVDAADAAHDETNADGDDTGSVPDVSFSLGMSVLGAVLVVVARRR